MRLGRDLRPIGDELARKTGLLFVIVLHNADHAGFIAVVGQVADFLRRCIDQLRRPVAGEQLVRHPGQRADLCAAIAVSSGWEIDLHVPFQHAEGGGEMLHLFEMSQQFLIFLHDGFLDLLDRRLNKFQH